MHFFTRIGMHEIVCSASLAREAAIEQAELAIAK
jgi:hypothetical protein